MARSNILLLKKLGAEVVLIAPPTLIPVGVFDWQVGVSYSLDDEMDLLHRRLFTALLEPSWPHGIETAIDMTLIGRYYERYADHAVSVSRRIHFQVTGIRCGICNLARCNFD